MSRPADPVSLHPRGDRRPVPEGLHPRGPRRRGQVLLQRVSGPGREVPLIGATWSKQLWNKLLIQNGRDCVSLCLLKCVLTSHAHNRGRNKQTQFMLLFHIMQNTGVTQLKKRSHLIFTGSLSPCDTINAHDGDSQDFITTRILSSPRMSLKDKRDIQSDCLRISLFYSHLSSPT